MLSLIDKPMAVTTREDPAAIQHGKSAVAAHDGASQPRPASTKLCRVSIQPGPRISSASIHPDRVVDACRQGQGLFRELRLRSRQNALPHVTHFASKPKTADYYNYGAALLNAADMGSLRVDAITSQNAVGFIAKKSKLSPSTVNCGLRTLRRALNLADEWGKIERAPKLSLAKGERQRDRVVSEAEFFVYRELCRDPWRDMATILYGTGMRPGEAYALRWDMSC